MKVLAWVALALMAFAWTYVTVTTENEEIAIITGLAGALSWALFAYFSLEIVIYDTNGNPITDRYPAMAVYGLMMAAPNVYIALTGPLEMVKNRGKLEREVT